MMNYWKPYGNIRRKGENLSIVVGSVKLHGAQINIGHHISCQTMYEISKYMKMLANSSDLIWQTT
jgi:hypothetical protein